MTALTQALEASQAKAIAALGKSYIRRTDDPDDSLYAAMLAGLGVDDELGVSFLLASWAVLREQRDQPPGEQAPAAKTTEPASDAQWSLIRKLADEKGTTAPVGPLSKAQAHTVIDQLKAGTYKADDYEIPF